MISCCRCWAGAWPSWRQPGRYRSMAARPPARACACASVGGLAEPWFTCCRHRCCRRRWPKPATVRHTRHRRRRCNTHGLRRSLGHCFRVRLLTLAGLDSRPQFHCSSHTHLPNMFITVIISAARQSIATLIKQCRHCFATPVAVVFVGQLGGIAGRPADVN